MKRILFSFLAICLCVSFVFGQSKVLTKSGEAHFYSKAPLEDIEASNDKVVAIIDFDKSEIAVKILIKKFEFKKSLMQEHFNENYMESDQFPSATFTGNLEGAEGLDLRKDGTHNVTVKGDIEIHGVKRPMETTAVLEVKNGKLHATTEFKVKTADHKIKIPKIVVKNIAEVIDVKLSFEFELQNS